MKVTVYEKDGQKRTKVEVNPNEVVDREWQAGDVDYDDTAEVPPNENLSEAEKQVVEDEENAEAAFQKRKSKRDKDA